MLSQKIIEDGIMPLVSDQIYSNQGNSPLIDLLDKDCKRMLDIGCGAGDNAALVRSNNRLGFFDPNSLTDKLYWWLFRFRLSLETSKFLSYGVVRNKLEMVLLSRDSITPYDMAFLRSYRFILIKGVQLWMRLRNHK
jgi:hypothetical protein